MSKTAKAPIARRLALILAVVCVAVPTLPASAQTGPPARSMSPELRLAERFAADALLMLEQDPLTLVTVDAAVALMEEAVRLVPGDADIWRIMLDLADLAERADLRAEAVAALGELVPDDEVIRWRRASLALEQFHTAEELVAGYERLLSEVNRDSLGDVVASRLALDLALLHQRRGDDREVGRWLAEATALDPGNRPAAALAAGYFRTRISDPLGQAELLLNVLLADPIDLTSQVELGRLLLENGAYRSAYRVLDIAAVGGGEIVPGLYADLAIVEWALGRPTAALRTIELRQRATDERRRDEMRLEQPEMGALELAQLTAPIDPVLATVRAALLAHSEHADAALALEQAVESYEQAITSAGGADAVDRNAIARLYLEQAWILLWLGGDPALAATCVEEADTLVPLSDEARARFEGWSAWRRQDLDEADRRLALLPDDDQIARLGRALVAQERGETRTAAKHMLAVARAKPGSLIGVWAAESLFQIVGQRTDLYASAKPLEDLIGSIPNIFDRYMEDPTLCLSIRMTPRQSTYDVYEPILVDLEIANNSPYPLAIHRDGPIGPHVLLEVSVSITHRGTHKLKPIIVDIDRRLTLAPYSRMRVPVDLRRHQVGQILDEMPMLGGIIRARCMLNFQFTSAGAVIPGGLGSSASTAPFRVDGVRFNRQWIERAMADLVATDQPPRDVTRLAVLSHLAGAGLVADLPPEDQQVFRDAVTALTEGFGKLDPLSQAWFLSVMRPGVAVSEVLAMARKTDHRLVKSAYLIYCLVGEDDPMIDAARRDADPKVRRLAELAVELIRRAKEAAEQGDSSLTRGG